MTGVPRIAIEESAVNDIILLLDAVVPNDEVARALEDPASLYTRYRAELRIFRQYLVPEPPAASRAEPSGADVPAELLSGSILR